MRTVQGLRGFQWLFFCEYLCCHVRSRWLFALFSSHLSKIIRLCTVHTKALRARFVCLWRMLLSMHNLFGIWISLCQSITWFHSLFRILFYNWTPSTYLHSVHTRHTRCMRCVELGIKWMNVGRQTIFNINYKRTRPTTIAWFASCRVSYYIIISWNGVAVDAVEHDFMHLLAGWPASFTYFMRSHRTHVAHRRRWWKCN